jgi:hypothetical protein
MHLTEFAPALSMPALESAEAPSVQVAYSQAQWARQAQMGGFPGSTFIPQADDTLRCPAGAPL